MPMFILCVSWKIRVMERTSSHASDMALWMAMSVTPKY